MDRRGFRNQYGFEEVYSALFVDFDNIFTRLEEIEPSGHMCLLPTRSAGLSGWKHTL